MRPGCASVVFLGMDSVYSARVLTALYDRGHEIRAVIKPIGSIETRRQDILTRSYYFTGVAKRAVGHLKHAPPRPDPDETDPFHVAGLHGCPCYNVGSASGPKCRELLERLDPDVIAIAFFNQLLRKRVLRIPRLGTVNAHPSLLPSYRGPSPLFWMLRNGETTGGVTVHLVDAGEDSGDILHREPVPIESGIRGPELLDHLADAAARLVTRAVDDLALGQAQPLPQDTTLASRHARPTHADFEVRFDTAAERVFSLVRGLAQWAPLWADLGGERFRLLDASGFEAEEELGADHVVTGEQIAVQCAPGVVILKARAISSPPLFSP